MRRSSREETIRDERASKLTINNCKLASPALLYVPIQLVGTPGQWYTNLLSVPSSCIWTPQSLGSSQFPIQLVNLMSLHALLMFLNSTPLFLDFSSWLVAWFIFSFSFRCGTGTNLSFFESFSLSENLQLPPTRPSDNAPPMVEIRCAPSPSQIRNNQKLSSETITRNCHQFHYEIQ